MPPKIVRQNEPSDLEVPRTLRDVLAIDRTFLANRRTLLSFVRTGLYFIFTGLAIMNLEMLHAITSYSIFFFIVGPLILLIGVITYFQVNRRINRSYRKRINNKGADING
ncbi:MAG TPA: DUF202 domain-containing protein, partial [Bacteroidetes bacterium]|nr:DUF202 domain-containing protein [Bacteroidota bacterium]